VSDKGPDKEFWELADSFINLANKHLATVPRSKVSATFLYAVARFNAFVVTANTETRTELEADKERAIAYFAEQYEKMLRENIDDHLANYEKYNQEMRTPK
jgi:Protein of unknown function (DUF3144)